MVKSIIYPVGTCIGSYTIIGEVIRDGGRQYYPVKCVCGKERIVRNDLFAVNVKGCGKCGIRLADHTGLIIKGHTVLGYSHNIEKVTYWDVQCVCGNKLPPKRIQSLKNCKGDCLCYKPPEVFNKTSKSGMFTFIEYTGEICSQGKSKIKVRCDCGKRLVVSNYYFKKNTDGCNKHKNPVEFVGGKAILEVSTEDFPNIYTTIDIEDYKKVYNTRWRAHPGRNTVYVVGNVGRTIKSLHQVVFPVEKGFLVDHQDQNGLNNSKSNLRETDKQGNARNTVKHRDNTSGHMGVSWKKDKLKWKAYISVNRKQIHLGYFDDFDEAAKSRKAAEVEYGFHENHGRG